jgi:hypothetical protein
MTEITTEFEAIAQAMLTTKGDLGKASRSKTIGCNAMQLREVVRKNPEIRRRYHELLAESIMEKSVHIAERVAEVADLKEQTLGGPMEIVNEVGEKEIIDMPADIKSYIEVSKELSRLIAEGKNQNMSAKAVVVLASKEDAQELLEGFLNS